MSALRRRSGRLCRAAALGDRGHLELFKLLAQEGVLFPDESTDAERVLVPGDASVANSILAQAVRARQVKRAG